MRMGFIIGVDDDFEIDNSAADIDFAIEALRETIPTVYEDTREMHLALTKLEECEMWLERAKISE
jgi:hypothetical protein